MCVAEAPTTPLLSTWKVHAHIKIKNRSFIQGVQSPKIHDSPSEPEESEINNDNTSKAFVVIIQMLINMDLNFEIVQNCW